jgi:hypothetical protein
MFPYHGGDKVAGGFYLNRRTWAIAVVNREGVLAGGLEDEYAKIPTLLALVVAPLAGAAFAMFLPFIGIAMVLDLTARKTWRRLRAAFPVGAHRAETKPRP